MESQNKTNIDGVTIYLPNDIATLKRKSIGDFVCEIHGPFQQAVGLLLSGQRGCPSCGRQRAGRINAVKRKLSQEQFFTKCKEIHNDAYSYEGIVYEHSLSKLILKCKKHGPFDVRADRHKSGQGCQICSYQKSAKRKFLSLDEWVSRSKETHAIEYDYSEVDYKGTWKKVTIICPIHGKFRQEASHHMRGADCPSCRGRISKIGNKWLASVNAPIREYFIKETKTWADGYDPDTNTLYLFNGDYWHGNPTVFDPNDVNPTTKKKFGYLYERTLALEKQYIGLGYNVVSIWEKDFKEDPSTLSSYQKVPR